MGSILGCVLANLSMSILCSRSVCAVVTEKSETTDVIKEAKHSIVVKPENVAGIWSAVPPQEECSCP